MRVALNVPVAGDIKFLERIEGDLSVTKPRLIHTDVRPAAEKKGNAIGTSVITVMFQEPHIRMDKTTVSRKIRKLRSLNSSKGINAFIAKQFKTLKATAEVEQKLLIQLDDTSGDIDPDLMRALEKNLEQKELASSIISSGFDHLSNTISAAAFTSDHIATSVFAKSVEKNVEIRLVHENGQPLLHRTVEVYAPTWYGASRITHAVTTKEGKFRFPYQLDEGKKEKLNLCVYEELLPRKGLFSEIGKTVRVVFTLDFFPSESLQQFGVDLYEYPLRNSKYLPRLRQPTDSRYRPQQDSLSYKLALLEAGAIPLLTDQAAKLASSVEQLEALYGVIDITLELCSKTTVDLLLNGIYPCHLLQSLEPVEGKYLVELNWDDYSKDDQSNALLHNVKIYLNEHEEDCLEVAKVQIQFRVGENFEDFSPEHPEFKKALYVVNSMALIKGEIVSHLGLGHLYTEQNAMAVFRTLRNNPLRLLLSPHLRGVMEINRRGDDLIFGKNGILNLTRLSLDGITQSLQHVLSGVCYSNFSPRKAIHDNHRFAHAENLFWNIVTEVVDEFFEENLLEIKKYWYEINAMSLCLHEHSLKHRAWEGKAYNQWACTNEIDQPEEGEVIVNGSRDGNALRPIVHPHGKEAPDENDLKRLKQFCRHAIFMATFWHWAVHSSQGRWGTNLKIASLAPRNLEEEDYRGVARPDASQQLSLAHVFTNFQRGHAIDNIHGDINQLFVQKLEENKNEFSKHGYNIYEMFGGVFI